MKNLLFTLVLLFSLHSYGQSNPVADAFIIMAYDVEGTDNALDTETNERLSYKVIKN